MANKECFIIAEVGVNHNGDESLAIQLVDVAIECGANAVKFQTFNSIHLVSSDAPTAEYQKTNSGDDNQLLMLQKLELSKESFKRIKEYCDSKNILFISTPFDLGSVDLLDMIGVDTFKIASGDLTHYQLLKHIALKNKKIILSTGMSNLEEVKAAVTYIKSQNNAYITLLHCISSYPTIAEETNLLSIKTLKDCFPDLEVGFSDHTEGNLAAIISLALGASVIEKHITLDNNLHGPDHKMSMNPEKFRKYIQKIRLTEKMLGDGIKRCMPSEFKNKYLARRSIAVKKGLKRGTVISQEDLISLRPDLNICGNHFEEIVGKRLIKDKKENEFLNWDDFLD